MSKKIKHVLGLSGGKDSAALAVYMSRNYPELDIEYFTTDTGKELPEVYEYLEQLELIIGKPIVRLNDGQGFDYWLKEHNNFLPSGRQRWCTIKMKLEPYERWIKPFLNEGYEIVSYIGIRADEQRKQLDLANSTLSNIQEVQQGRTGYRPGESVQSQLKSRFPFVEDGIKKQGVIDILESAGLGLPKYYDWRSRSGCTFCFFQRKIEWVRLKERHPEAFEEAKAYEKQAQDSAHGETFYWMGPNEPLSTLESPERIAQIKANHEKVKARFEKKKAREQKRRLGLHAMVDESQLIDTLDMDAMYDIEEGGGACVTCYK